MVNIPRYQPRPGPAFRTLQGGADLHLTAGDEYRVMAKAAQAAGAVYEGVRDLLPAEKSASPSEIDRMQAEVQALTWRRGQLEEDGQAVDAEQAELSRQAAGEGLSSGVRAAFDALTAPRVEGYSALADSRRDDQRSRAARSISQARQALGVEEFLKLADVAPSQARAALGSAAAAAGDLARASGADEAGVAEARRATLVAAQVRRIGETIGRDPARAAKILEEEGGVLPDAQRARLSREVELEQALQDANLAAERMAGEHPDLVDDLDGFVTGMEAAAGEGAHRIEAFRAAGMGAWRAARAAREAMESQAWAAVSPLLEPESGVHSWTQLPADLWRSLSERQQRAVQARLDAPWAESDGVTLDAIRSMAVSDPDGFRGVDLMAYAIELKPSDLDRMLARQALARAGGTEWGTEQEAMANAAGQRGNALLVRTASAPAGSPPSIGRQSDLTEQDKALNLYLDGRPGHSDGLHASKRTGQVVRWRAGAVSGLEEEPVSDEEAEAWRRQRLGLKHGVPSAERLSEKAVRDAYFPHLAPGVEKMSKTERAQAQRRGEAARILDENPSIRAFLSLIAFAEGDVRYNSMGGDRQGRTYDRPIPASHPGRVSGRYQINGKTWVEFGRDKLGLTDYSPRSQDLAAVWLMKELGIVDALDRGDIGTAIDLAAERWASFPLPKTGESKFTIDDPSEPSGKRRQPSKPKPKLQATYEGFLEREPDRNGPP